MSSVPAGLPVDKTSSQEVISGCASDRGSRSRHRRAGRPKKLEASSFDGTNMMIVRPKARSAIGVLLEAASEIAGKGRLGVVHVQRRSFTHRHPADATGGVQQRLRKPTATDIPVPKAARTPATSGLAALQGRPRLKGRNFRSRQEILRVRECVPMGDGYLLSHAVPAHRSPSPAVSQGTLVRHAVLYPRWLAGLDV